VARETRGPSRRRLLAAGDERRSTGQAHAGAGTGLLGLVAMAANQRRRERPEHEQREKITLHGKSPWARWSHASNLYNRCFIPKRCSVMQVSKRRAAIRFSDRGQAFCGDPTLPIRARLGRPVGGPYDRAPAMAKTDPLDVLVLGEHPAAYLCAALLKHKTKLHVLHATLPGEAWPDRLVLLNPALFELHPLLEPLRRKVELTPVYGLRFLSDTPSVASEHRSRSALAFVAPYRSVRGAMMKLAAAQDVEMVTPKVMEIHRLDENGIDVTLGKAELRPRMLVLAGMPDEAHRRVLGLPDGWGADIVHRYTFVKLPARSTGSGQGRWADLGSRPVIPMSLNLREMLFWAWLLPGEKGMQLAVEQPVEAAPLDILQFEER